MSREEKTQEGREAGAANMECIFDAYDLKFYMSRDEVAGRISLSDSGEGADMAGTAELIKIGASSALLFFDHEGRLWQAKVYYELYDHAKAEALMEKMSQDFRFQTPSARVAFELTENEDGPDVLYIRYTEANMKRIYLHHMMAVGAAKKAAAEEMERAVKEKEEEEYIPSGPLIF